MDTMLIDTHESCNRLITNARSHNLELADIFRKHGSDFRKRFGKYLSSRQMKVMHDIEMCRTKAMGYTLKECDSCHGHQIIFDGCGNRYCPKCQNLESEKWLRKRKSDLLPVPYFHIVPTLPSQLRPLAKYNMEVICNILLKTGWETIKELGADPKHLGARMGAMGFLHTWNQKMGSHLHAHYMVPCGGLSFDEKRWVECKKHGKDQKFFFTHVRVYSKKFRGKFLYYLEKAYGKNKLSLKGSISNLRILGEFESLICHLKTFYWNVHIEPTLHTPEKLVDYLSRYVNKIVICDNRLVRLEDDQVTFKYLNRTDDNGVGVQQKTVHVFRFIGRFLHHVMPKNYVRIRYFGLWANPCKKKALSVCKELLCVEPSETEADEYTLKSLFEELTGADITICPICQKGKMKTIFLSSRIRDGPNRTIYS